MLHRLCGPRQFLSFSLAAVLPGGVLNALTSALKGGNPLTLSTHRLRRGLPGYLILFAPHAFAPVSVTDQKVAFATGVPPYLYAFHRYTWNSTFLFCTQVSQFPMTSTVEPWAFTSDLRNHLRALYAQYLITLATYVLPHRT